MSFYSDQLLRQSGDLFDFMEGFLSRSRPFLCQETMNARLRFRIASVDVPETNWKES